MRIEDILRHKGRDVTTISGSRTVLEALQVLVDLNIGSLVVMEGRRPVGIVTERDILRHTCRAADQLAATPVEDIMTRDMITAEPNDRLASTMDLMTERRIRHLPVMEGPDLVGIISIGDLVNAFRDVAEQENDQLRRYIHGVG